MDMGELRFDGKRVIVTGGGRGFGRSHAKLLASRGAKVLIADYGVELDGTGSSAEPAEQVAKEIEADGGEAIGVFANVAEEQEANRVVQTAVDEWGGLDILVNNAGISDPGWLLEKSREQYERMTNFQYYSTVWMTRAAWPHIVGSKGNIVCTASESILGNVPKAPDYSAAKGAVHAFMRAMALEGSRVGVRVNAISPRGATRMASPEMLEVTFEISAEHFREQYLEQMQVHRASAAVGFLAHDSCPLTAHTLVCGGNQVMLLAFVRTQGITVEGEITPEDVAANIDQILDMTGSTVMHIDNP
jgi:NAD(P)-dependent dehydrogenase (short-subunit alcohol dehydrogenase family)